MFSSLRQAALRGARLVKPAHQLRLLQGLSKQTTPPVSRLSEQHRLQRIQTAAYITATNVKEKDTSLFVDSGSSMLELPYLWLRDHCRCDICYNHQTNQKNILAQQLDFHMKPSDVTFSKDDLLTLTWPDGHVSRFTLDWLKVNAYPGPAGEKVDKLLWDGSSLKQDDLPKVEFDHLMQTEEGLKTLLHSLLKYGIGLVTGVSPDTEGTQKASERVCFIQRTMFGDMWSFTADAARGDTAYTNIGLGAHNDTTYLSQPCGIQVFHCIYHDGEGGQTLLVDGFKAVEDLRSSDPEAFDILTKVPLHHENNEPGHHVRSLDPIIKIHPITGQLEVLRYNQYDRAPMATVPPADQPAVYRAIAELGKKLQRPEGELWLKLKPGTVLFVDNWRVLHGRSAFTGNRRVTGCYLPRDDWISKARLHGLVWR